MEYLKSVIDGVKSIEKELNEECKEKDNFLFIFTVTDGDGLKILRMGDPHLMSLGLGSMIMENPGEVELFHEAVRLALNELNFKSKSK